MGSASWFWRWRLVCSRKLRRRCWVVLLVIGSVLVINSILLAVLNFKYRDWKEMRPEFLNDLSGVFKKSLLYINKTKNSNDFLKVQIQMSNGEQLAREIIQKKCSRFSSLQQKRSTSMKITTNSRYRLMFCPMCKVASTFWTRFFKMLELNKTSPYDVPISGAPATKESLTVIHGKPKQSLDYMYKFLFVRNPYSRVLSAFVDKFFAPNPTFWSLASSVLQKRKHRGKIPVMEAPKRKWTANKCGSNLTFEEYIRAINDNHKIGRTVDCHDTNFYLNCHVCELGYNFVGKMETFLEDSFHIFRNMGLNSTIAELSDNFSNLSTEDALFDTVTSPFAWRKSIEKCITWEEALKRVWRKLQIRGVVGKFEFPLTVEQSDNISAAEFMTLVRDYQKKTPLLDRKRQKQEALIEIYRTVPFDELLKLKGTFKNDFILFDYYDAPVDIFDRSTSIQYYGYLEV